uniref:CHK kinase-like domain-containing protein n=1 Tax=Lygus hesperus TaxID=30085 RepID=A0A0K8TDT1_LYGHE
MTDDKDWLESVFRRKAYEETPLRVLEAEGGAAVGKNENYLSNLTKMKVTVLLGSGKTKKRTVMIKNRHTGAFMKNFTSKLGVFMREITMYRDILPRMADLMEECGDTDEPMWAKCYDVRLYDRLVLEDLTASGYKMGNKTDELSLESCLLVVKNLAKFHGLSHVLLKRSEIPLEIFRYNVWKNLEEGYNAQNMSSYTKLLRAIGTWGDDWEDVRQRFEKAMPTLTERMMQAMEPVPDDFVVLNHGDCWTNNLMFRHAPDSECPVSMRFVDFQLCFTGPPSYDLEYLLVSTVRPEFYTKNWDLIVRTYCDALKSTMLKLNYEGPVPDFDAMKQLMKRTHIYYLFNAIGITPVVMGKSEDIPDIEEALMKEHEARLRGEEGNTWNLFDDLKGPAKMVVQFALRDAVDNGLI